MRNIFSTKGAWSEWTALPKAMPFLKPYRKFLVISMLLTVGISAVALLEPWPLAVIFDSVLGNHPPPGVLQPLLGEDPSKYTMLWVVVAAGFMQVILSHALTVVSDYVNARIEMNMVLDLRSALFSHVQRLSLTFHDNKMTGMLMSQINIQANALGEVVMAFPPLAQSLLTLIGMFTVAFLIDWQVTLIAMVVLPFLYYAIGVYGTKIVPRIKRVQSLEFKSLSIVFESMSMLRVIVGFGRQNYEHRRFFEQGKTAVDARVRLTIWQTAFGLMVSAATALGTALVLGVGALHVIQGKITIGQLYVLISYIASVYQPLEAISTTLGDMNQRFVILNSSLELLDNDPEVVEDPDPVDLGRARGDLAFDGVGFAYKERVDTLKDISFQIKAGQRVAIVGPTGAGKTTLASLVIRYYDPAEGRILMDGVDIRKLSLDSLRNQISLVPQEPLLFSGTITENIRYGRLTATMEEVVDAAKGANAHDFISRLPDGYQTELGERGAQLSGGERQRICVARAFVRNAPILILDEPTSSIDSKTENVILDALDKLMLGRTSFMIAHRLSTVRDADLILVINDGGLVEQGTHEELVSLGGLYSQLYNAQTQQRRSRKYDDDEQEAPPPLPPEVPPEAVPPTRQEEAEQAAEAERDRAAPLDEPVPDSTYAELENGDGTLAPAGDNGHATPATPATPPPHRHLHPPTPSAPDRVLAPMHMQGSPRMQSLGRPARLVRIGEPRQEVGCDICGRILLTGESGATYLVMRGQRRAPKHVCELCWERAEEQGWTLAPSA